jgi:hypothetical protein
MLEIFRLCSFALAGLMEYDHKIHVMDNKLALKGIRDKC